MTKMKNLCSTKHTAETARRQATGWWGTFARQAPDGRSVFTVQRAPELRTGIQQHRRTWREVWTDTGKDVSSGKDTQPRASAGIAAAHMPQWPQWAAPGAGDAWGSRSVHHRMKQKAAAVRLGVYPEELSTHGHRTCTGASEQLCLEAPNLEAPKCPWWLNGWTVDCIYSYNGILLSSKKK